jgi:hypothetical protein
MEIQTRSWDGALNYFTTMKEALEFSNRVCTEAEHVWKISFSLENGERVRLVRDRGDMDFRLEQMDDAIARIQAGRREDSKKL